MLFLAILLQLFFPGPRRCGLQIYFCFLIFESNQHRSRPKQKGDMMNVLADELEKLFPELEPMVFYRAVFPAGELDQAGAMTKGKYTAIALEIPDKGKIKRYSVTDELAVIENLQQSENFCILAPVSYAGKTRESKNARYMYALVVEIDNLVMKNGEQEGLHRLMAQWTERVHLIPQPTFLIASGTGLHLYYQFEKPIPMYPHIVKSIADYKNRLTELIWNRHVTVSSEKEQIQYESIFQAFRIVGTRTKLADKVRAFLTGEKVNIEYMNRFVEDKYKIVQKKQTIPINEAKEKYPDWYEKRIVENRKIERGRWICKKDLYDWWLKKIGEGAEAVVGHRYYCMMCLAVYAIKCNVPREELEKDCFMLLDMFEARTDNDNNHFTKKDMMDALQAYDDAGLVTYPLASIEKLSGIDIERNKRNGRKRADHLKYMRGVRGVRASLGENVSGGGRPSKRDIVISYLKEHPEARKCDVIRETGLSKPTVYKYYDEGR